ncbi:unnamed protein product, partial [Porites lobata]
IKRVLVLQRHHAEHCSNLRDQKDFLLTNESFSAIHIVFLIAINFFFSASLLSVMALCAERFLAIHLHLRYQELVTCKRVAAVVVSIWVI